MRAASRSSSAARPAAAGWVASQPFLLSSFIGRQAELKRGVTLLAQHRLVTLTGTGGCGKTRLAVELAAARAQALSFARIAVSLDRHLALLGGAPRTVPARHATIQASFDWSYQLLQEDERVLLAQLSVFAGGFGLDDVVAVCPEASIEVVVRLVSRSLVVLIGGHDELRYRLPETIREFAAGHLADVPQLAARTRQRHAEHYLALAEQAEPQLTRVGQDDWLARLALEQDNLRAALAWSRDQPAPEPCARLAAALAPYWLERSNWSECRFWLEAAEKAGPIPAVLEARVLNRRCYLEMWAGDMSIVPQLANRSLSLLDGLDELVEQGRAHGAATGAKDPSASWAEGEELGLDEALAYASRGRGRRRRPAAGWPSLTPAELEVVRLVARQLSNPDIAERLFISRATVKTHLIHIFAKLGVRSRSELAAEAIQRGID